MHAELDWCLVLWSFCSAKGGVGTSVVAAGFACQLAADGEGRLILADFCGAQPDICGVDVGGVPGVVDWLYSGADVGVGAIENLMVEVAPGVELLPRGTGPLPYGPGEIEPERLALLVTTLARAGAVADVGVIGADPFSAQVVLLTGSSRVVGVTRACYLALRQLARIPVALDGMVEVSEAGRSLRTLDIEAVAGFPVSARLPVDPGISRSVDAGVLMTRPPRAIRRMARDLRDDLVDSTFRESTLGRR